MSDGKDISQYLSELQHQEEKLKIEKALALDDALKSKDAEQILKAQNYLTRLNSSKKDNSTDSIKSLLLDPQDLNPGWKDKNYSISFAILRQMARVPIIKSIIETRIEQVLNFCQPQPDKYSPGFVIRPKGLEKGQELNRAQRKRVDELTKFIMNCGDGENKYHGDDFVSFTRKVIRDSLELDQGTFEIVKNKKGEISEFLATDGATFRIAETFNDELEKFPEKVIDGYLPYYVQVYQSRIVAEFYPWELGFIIRNPQSNIYSNGYGRSELEDLMHHITSIINADLYNANYFKVGSNPKGIIRVTGEINPARLEEFRVHWQSQMAGVANAHKVPIINADKMDFISTQQSNKDMEYAKYQEYLIKLICAAYKIDPTEINFAAGSGANNSLFNDGSAKDRVDYSRDKGLKPILRNYASYLNKMILEEKDPSYEVAFVGIDAETPEMELEQDIKAVANWETVNEVRKRRGMDEIEGGDIILNPIYLQNKTMGMMGNPESNAAVSEFEGEQEENPFENAIKSETERLFAK